MAIALQKKTGGELEVKISGFEKGIAPSPYDGIADLKNVNISSIKGEVSVAYSRVRQDVVPVSGGTMTFASGNTYAYSATKLPNGTWIKATQTNAGLTINTYYYCVVNMVGVAYNLYTDMGVTAVTGSAGSVTFDTLNMGIPIDYTVEQSAGGGVYRYYILDASGIIWANGTATGAASSMDASGLTSATTWQAITPHGTSTNSIGTFSGDEGSIQIMYATDSNNSIQASYLIAFTTGQVLYCKNATAWPSVGGSALSVWQSLHYSGAQHKSILGNDQVIYFTDGPGVGIIQQKTGKQFNPTDATTFNYTDANYLMAPTDTATRLAMIPSGNGLSLVVGGQQNNLYIYPTYQSSTASGGAPTTLLWMPESNTQYLLPVNNYVLIFAGNKGNIYLTNGSSVVPLMTVPDYIVGSATYPTTPNYVQDPYFIWGGAMYLRGRVFFSIKDGNASHTGNCGGVWSFVPSFSAFTQQDVGLALRMEGSSAALSGTSTQYDGYAPVIFAGNELSAQQADGPQYIAAWSQSVNSIDFSGINPVTNGTSVIETDAIPLGTFLEKKTWSQFEIKFSAPLVAGESIAVYYRTSLEGAWASAGAVSYEPTSYSALVNGFNFQAVQLVQFQIQMTSTATNPSWVRIKEMYLR